MSTAVDLALLGRYFDGTATPDERAAVEAWIGSDPARRAALAELGGAWRGVAERLQGPYDAETAWERLARSRGLGRAEKAVARLALVRPGQQVDFTVPKPPVWSAMKVAGLAAAIVGAVAIGGISWRALAGRSVAPVAVASATREYATPRGQRGIIRLPDGTEVMLNAATRLRVAAAFGAAGAGRDVYLDGEAYFTVVHDTARPFAVHTSRGITRDVGTRFNVRAYGEDGVERIAVGEGAVAVRGSTTAAGNAVEVSLRAGQVAALSAEGRVSVVPAADVARELAWAHGRLELDAVPLGEAARRLARWYDLDVRVADAELAARLVTGSYGDETIPQILTAITTAVGARYEVHGRTVVISSATGAR